MATYTKTLRGKRPIPDLILHFLSDKRTNMSLIAFSIFTVAWLAGMSLSDHCSICLTIPAQPPFSEETKAMQPFINTSPNAAQSDDALLWLSVLNSYTDMGLSGKQLALKYKNMSIAATVLSATAKGSLRKKYWSERAIGYGKMSMGVINAMVPDKDAHEIEEVNTRLLIALAMNYYEGGEVGSKEIARQFEKISKSYLVRTGFCTNRILLSLHSDGIIQLPETKPFKYT